MVRLSALVCVQNQDGRLADCLRSLSFCDEIVVVADRCTDRSQDIARRSGALVLDGIFPLESQRRAAGVEACSGDWILEVEPDEEVSSALAWEIRAALKQPPAGDHFDLRVENYLGGVLVRHGWTGALGAARATRLYRRGVKQWRAQRLQGGARLSGLAAGVLNGALRRTVGHDTAAMVDRVNRLSALRAEDMADACRPGQPVLGLAAGMAQFAASYLIRAGWREGRRGLLVALLSGLYPLLAHIRAREVLEARARVQAAQPTLAPVRTVIELAAR